MTAKDRALQLIAREFEDWARDNGKANPNGNDGLAFYGYLQRERPQLLEFKGSDWTTVHAFLRNRRLVSN